MNTNYSLILYILNFHSPIGLIGQYYNKQIYSIKWLYPSNQLIKTLQLYLEQIAKVVTIGRIRSKQLFGIDPVTIVLPIDLSQYLNLLEQALYCQAAFTDFIGQIDNHFPSDLIF